MERFRYVFSGERCEKSCYPIANDADIETIPPKSTLNTNEAQCLVHNKFFIFKNKPYRIKTFLFFLFPSKQLLFVLFHK